MGTPVVSYAPLPMLHVADDCGTCIIVAGVVAGFCGSEVSTIRRHRDESYIDLAQTLLWKAMTGVDSHVSKNGYDESMATVMLQSRSSRGSRSDEASITHGSSGVPKVSEGRQGFEPGTAISGVSKHRVMVRRVESTDERSQRRVRQVHRSFELRCLLLSKKVPGCHVPDCDVAEDWKVEPILMQAPTRERDAEKG